MSRAKGVMLGAIEGFVSTWVKARSTFGEGAPQDGAQYDNSPELHGMQSQLVAVTTRSQWTAQLNNPRLTMYLPDICGPQLELDPTTPGLSVPR